MADEMPLDWTGPYSVHGHPQLFTDAGALAEYLTHVSDNPVRLTGRWLAGTLELTLEALSAGCDDEQTYLEDWRAFQRDSSTALASKLALSENGTLTVLGGNAEMAVTVESMSEFFLTYDIMNAHTVIHAQRLEEPGGIRRYKAVKFAPHRGSSSLQLIDLGS